MSNKPIQFKNKKNRLSKNDAKAAIKMSGQSGMKSIDFGDRILDKTMLVTVATSEIRIGNATQKMRDIPVSFNVVEKGDLALLKYLEGFSPDDIDKVIMDNGDGFKHKTLQELISDVKNFIKNGLPTQVQYPLPPRQTDPRDPRSRFPKLHRPSPRPKITTISKVYTEEEANACVGTLSILKPFTSNARWPDGTISGSVDQISTDSHETFGQAKAVCDALVKEGFGGEGTIFPMSTWVGTSK
jgi:hypothetical protein